MNENNGSEFHVEGQVYQVQDMLGEDYTDDEDWYEYRVQLVNQGGEIVDEWDSLGETYNGVPGQRLSKDKAEESLQEIRQDVRKGNADMWFSRIDE